MHLNLLRQHHPNPLNRAALGIAQVMPFVGVLED
jgi:hypothetical protein